MSMQFPPPPATISPELINQKEEILLCIENLSLALASILLYPSTHERMIGKCLVIFEDYCNYFWNDES